MRANISEELIELINDKIYFDLMMHVTQSRMQKAIQDGKDGYADYLHNIYKQIKNDRQNVVETLRKCNVKIYEVVKDSDGQFVEYPYSVRITGGGFKEGTMRYWKAAIMMELRKRMSKYFGGDSSTK